MTDIRVSVRNNFQAQYQIVLINGFLHKLTIDISYLESVEDKCLLGILNREVSETEKGGKEDESDGWFSNSPAERVQRIGKRLAQVAEISVNFCTVDEIEGARIQAQALAKNATVELTDGLVHRLDDDELAFIVAHELAHLKAGHASKRQKLGEEVVDELVERGKAVDRKMKTAGRGFLYRAMVNVMNVALVAGTVTIAGRAYSRENEYEADEIALRFMAQAGYDKAASLEALRKIHTSHRSGGLVDSITSTHPQYPERIRRLERLVRG